MPLPAYENKPQPFKSPVRSFGLDIDPIAALKNCEIGKSFVVDSQRDYWRIYGFANRLSMTVRSALREDGRYDIWRTA